MFFKRLNPYRNGLILAVAAGLALIGFLLFSQATYRLGFPLDDAWIHQTYARNLGQHGEFAFIPGQPSAGSTAPLWSALLAIGYLLQISPLHWAYLLGWVALTGLAWLGNAFGENLAQGSRWRIPIIGILLAGEWHLVWAAGSGMETAVYSGLILLVFWLLSRERISPLFAGLTCGISIWVRPDGLTLLGPILFVIVLTRKNWPDRLRACAWAGLGLLAGLIPYLVFNRWLGGTWWPNTFYAKQAEYAIRLQESYLARYARLATLPMIGVGVFLLPGFLFSVYYHWQKRSWVGLAAFLWWAGYTAIYAATLAVDYQHGRYLIPAMPVYFVLGVVGTTQILAWLNTNLRGRLIRFAWVLLIALVWGGFYFQGAAAYSNDVAIIESEMVETGKWIAQNTPQDALLGVHDIGAIGYYSQHRMVDMAGLISPEVIPFIRDETRLSAYLDQRKVNFLVTFPGWYPQLVEGRIPIYETGGKYSPEAGGENMAVYLWGRNVTRR